MRLSREVLPTSPMPALLSPAYPSRETNRRLYSRGSLLTSQSYGGCMAGDSLSWLLARIPWIPRKLMMIFSSLLPQAVARQQRVFRTRSRVRDTAAPRYGPPFPDESSISVPVTLLAYCPCIFGTGPLAHPLQRVDIPRTIPRSPMTVRERVCFPDPGLGPPLGSPALNVRGKCRHDATQRRCASRKTQEGAPGSCS
jgi:hypothetical protein